MNTKRKLPRIVTKAIHSFAMYFRFVQKSETRSVRSLRFLRLIPFTSWLSISRWGRRRRTILWAHAARRNIVLRDLTSIETIRDLATLRVRHVFLSYFFLPSFLLTFLQKRETRFRSISWLTADIRLSKTRAYLFLFVFLSREVDLFWTGRGRRRRRGKTELFELFD